MVAISRILESLPGRHDVAVRLLRAFAGEQLGGVFFLQDSRQMPAEVLRNAPPLFFPIAVSGDLMCGLHLHPRHVDRGRLPVVVCRPEETSWAEQAPSAVEFVAQRLALRDRLPDSVSQLSAPAAFRKFQWATGGAVPWSREVESSIRDEPAHWELFSALGLAGLEHRWRRLLSEREAGSSDARLLAELRDLQREGGAFFPAARMEAALHAGAGRPGEQARALSVALLAPFYTVGRIEHLAEVSLLGRSAWDRGAALPARVCLGLDYPDADSRLREMLPGLAMAGSVRTLFDEALNTGFLLGDYAAILPIAREAALRMPEREWLVPLLDLHAGP